MDFELTEEERMLKDTVARFVDREVIPLAPEIDDQERFPEENFKAMADMGLFGISISERNTCPHSSVGRKSGPLPSPNPRPAPMPSPFGPGRSERETRIF